MNPVQVDVEGPLLDARWQCPTCFHLLDRGPFLAWVEAQQKKMETEMPQPDIEPTLTQTMQTINGKNLMTDAMKEFPILGRLGLAYKYNPGGGEGFLEFWPGDEPGTKNHPRPPEFPLGQMGVEVYNPKTRPSDIMGDVASHHLVNVDPPMQAYSQQFQESMTPEQQQRLHEQYVYAQENFGETRPEEHWRNVTGMPGYFRGYAFDQWETPKELYTQEQMTMFDEMMQYLRK
jgi:hypothetical protein